MDMYQSEKAMGAVKKGKSDKPEGQQSRDDRSNLHEEPASFHPDMIVSIDSRVALRPDAGRPFKSINRKGHHANRHAEKEPSWNLEVLSVPESSGGHNKTEGVEGGNQQNASAAESFPDLRHEPPHGRYDDEGPDILHDKRQAT